MTQTATRKIIMTANAAHRFAIEYHGDASIIRRRVEAEYVKIEDGMVVFKDKGHGVVFMLPPNQLVAVVREDSPACAEIME